MAILSALQSSTTPATLIQLTLKYGLGAVLAIVLTLFLMQSVSANQEKTLAAITQHNTDSQKTLRDQLEILRIICANLTTNHTQKAYCFAVGNQPALEPQP